MSRRRRVLAALVAGVLPWVVVLWENGAYPLFSVGFLYTESLSFTSLLTYLDAVGTVPPEFRPWPVATALWIAGVGVTAADVDRRVAAGLLALAAGSVVSLSLALSRQQTVTGVPLGALWLAAAAAFVYAGGRE